jgi:hypothetical protein
LSSSFLPSSLLPFGRPRPTREDNIKMNFKQIKCEVHVIWILVNQRRFKWVVNTVKGREYFGWTNNSELLKMDYAPYNPFFFPFFYSLCL